MAAVARAAFPRGTPYLHLRDALGPVFTDQQFAALFPSHGQPAEAPWRLALVTLLQFAENLSDRRAADAWGHAGPFGAILPLDDALAFIADEPAFWIPA